MLYVRFALGSLSFNTDGSRNQQSFYWVALHGEITHLLNHWLYYYSLLFAELSPMRDHSQNSGYLQKNPDYSSFFHFITSIILKMSMVAIVT